MQSHGRSRTRSARCHLLLSSQQSCLLRDMQRDSVSSWATSHPAFPPISSLCDSRFISKSKHSDWYPHQLHLMRSSSCSAFQSAELLSLSGLSRNQGTGVRILMGYIMPYLPFKVGHSSQPFSLIFIFFSRMRIQSKVLTVHMLQALREAI